MNERPATSPDPRSAAAIEVRDLVIILGGRRILHNLTFAVPSGQVMGLLGPSGCGKTTLMRCVVGVQQTGSGVVLVLGTPAGSAALRHRVGYVTQACSIYTDLSARDNVRYFAAFRARHALPPTRRWPTWLWLIAPPRR